MTNFLAMICENHLSLFFKYSPNLCIWAISLLRFPWSIDHFLSLGVFRKLAVSTVRVSCDTNTNWLVDISFSRRFPSSIEHNRRRRLTDWHAFWFAVIGLSSVCHCEQLAECHVIHVLVRWRDNVREGTWRVVELAEGHEVGLITCEGGGDVAGVVTPLVGGVAKVFHGDQVVELRVQLAVQEVEGKEEDREGQVEVEEEKRLKEVRSWMTMEMKWQDSDLEPWGVRQDEQVYKSARSAFMLMWCACCACCCFTCCSCCSWSHAWSHCSCCCRRFRRNVSVAIFSDMEVYSLHIPWNLPTNFHSDLIATILQMYLLSLCALLSQQSHLFRICVVSTCNDSRRDLHKLCQVPRNCQCKWMTLGFLFGSKNFCKLFCVSWEVFVLHGYDWIHWVAKSCTTTAYRWLCRDSQP